MTTRERRTAWIGAAGLVACLLVIWFFPADFEVAVFPGDSFVTEGAGGTPSPPEIPLRVFGVAALVVVLGLGLAWYLPWLGRRLASRVGRGVHGAVCAALAAIGLGGIPALIGAMEFGEIGDRSFGSVLLLLGVGLLLWFVAGARGLVAVLRGPTPSPRFGSAKGEVRIGADFDDPVEGFEVDEEV